MGTRKIKWALQRLKGITKDITGTRNIEWVLEIYLIGIRYKPM